MKILTPLRYCGSRGMSAYEEEGDCNQFASEILYGMPLCDHHAVQLARAMEDEGVELVKDDLDAKGSTRKIREA